MAAPVLDEGDEEGLDPDLRDAVIDHREDQSDATIPPEEAPDAPLAPAPEGAPSEDEEEEPGH
jgi:hypothetical protein